MLYHRNEVLAVGVDAGTSGVNIVLLGDLARRYYAVAILCDHRKRAARQIAETAREVRIRPVDQILVSQNLPSCPNTMSRSKK